MQNEEGLRERCKVCNFGPVFGFMCRGGGASADCGSAAPGRQQQPDRTRRPALLASSFVVPFVRPAMMTLLPVLALLLLPEARGQRSSNGGLGVAVQAKNVSVPVGSEAVLSCQSPRMVWTRDRLKDRQRVVHWDVARHSPKYSVERVLDMSPGARLRVYNNFNKGRVSIPTSAFKDGNFSLLINNVVQSDRGVYTCNLHHHYCQIQDSFQIQLNVTKSANKEKRYWDGEKTILVVLAGSSVVLPCVNRNPIWRDGLQEDQQQVAHWDFQPPGVRPDRAERLVDLYASGERRDYGPLFAQRKMSVAEDAFTLGDFSLSISDLEPADKGLYSCHLHHHYCGLHERRIFRLTVGPPPAATSPTSFSDGPEPRKDEAQSPHVVNVVLPEYRGSLVQHLGYFLASFLLLALIAVAVVVLTRRRKKRGLAYDLHTYGQRNVNNGAEISLECTEMNACVREPLNSDYKNNLLKERHLSKGCNKDLDGKPCE
ncbi:matrix remodeling-associated protein 8-like isoform X2 [Syngnathoides biaculeatus]|uniref:matrix remodeling-associated protein 8-like isoform X2 n=1 Tax=Syngnathoides biaculeatus TaxID=300417 RepID=UPI002ADE70BE|nr:matrix remodeling-associated protein 8-like isoform X2 [Syngnathoides biaculeatus]